MCDPVSLGIMGGAKVASTVLQAKAASAVKQKREQAIAATDADLNKYAQVSRQSYGQSFDASTPEAMTAAIDDARQARTADYQGAIMNPQTIVPDAASSAAKNAIADALTKSTAFSKDLAARKAAAEAFGAASATRDLTQQKAGQVIDTQGDFARGRTQVGQLQLAAADRAGDKYANLAGLADALGTIGSAGYSFATSPSVVSGIKWNPAQQGLFANVPAGYYGPGG